MCVKGGRLRVLLISLLAICPRSAVSATPTVTEARAFMDKVEAQLLQLSSRAQRAAWVEENFITGDTEAIAAQENERAIARTTQLVGEAKRFEGLAMPADLAREFKLLKLSLTLPAPADAQLRSELTQIASSL